MWMMRITKRLYVRNRTEWRAWLEKNHKVDAEVWVVFYKKHTGRLSMPYDDAVEEALCFGWIDSVIQRIDDEKYCRKFTPRKDSSNWSALNRRRAAKMIQEGKMTGAGVAKLYYSGIDDQYDRTPNRKAKDLSIPEYLNHALLGNQKARQNFDRLASSYRRQYILWIATAKRDATREKRVAEAIRLLADNKRLGMR